jgi:Fe-S-cluster containining protein
MPDIDFSSLKDIESKSKRGEYGQWRRDYLRRLRQSLEEAYGQIRSSLQADITGLGGEITCGKGCTECCHHFLSVPVSHALLITEHLYASPEAMSAFKRGYARWRSALEDNPEAGMLLAQLETLTTLSPEVQAAPQDLLHDYHRFGIPCAFLDGKKCAIYAVRPIVCAAYNSVSPQECCRPGSDIPASIVQIKPSEDLLRRMSQLTDPRLSWHQEPLPEIVYKLLTRGLPDVANEVFALFDAEAKANPSSGG